MKPIITFALILVALFTSHVSYAVQKKTIILPASRERVTVKEYEELYVYIIAQDKNRLWLHIDKIDSRLPHLIKLEYMAENDMEYSLLYSKSDGVYKSLHDELRKDLAELDTYFVIADCIYDRKNLEIVD
jgi:hypothetical protein